MLSLKVKILLASFLITLSVIAYVVLKKANSNNIAKQVLDTLSYTEKDYDLMRDFYNSDTAFQKKLGERIQSGDSSAIQFKKLLITSYELRYNAQLEEQDIKGMIYAYQISKNVLDKFSKIDNQLKEFEESNAPKNAEDSTIQRHQDSIMNLIREGKQRK
jgi:hypothetical protein